MPNIIMFRGRLLLLFLSFSLSLSWSTENNIIGAFSSSSSSSTSSVRHQQQRRTQWDPSACKKSKNASTLSGCQKHSATSTTKSMYYTNSTKGSNTALDITLGTIAGIVCLFGLLFLVDRELYYTVVIAGGERIIPARLRGDAIQRYGRRICTSILPMNCCGQGSSGNNGSSSNNDLTVVTTMCDDDDDDDESDTPYGELRETAFSPAHLTEETAVYLAEQQMKLEEEEEEVRREQQNNIRTNNSMWSSLLPFISSWGSSSSKTTATTTKQRVSTPIFDESDKKYRGPDAEMVEFNEVIPPPPPTTSTTIGNNSNHNIHHHHHHDNDATTATELPPGVQKMKSGIQLCIMGAIDTIDEARSRCLPTVCQHNSPTPITTNSSNTTLLKTRLSSPRRISTSSSRQRPKRKMMVFPDIAMNGTPKDKYHIECESEEGSIQYKGSSYESDEYTAPW